MVLSYGVVVFSIIIFINFMGSHGVYFDCDPVNQGHYCICARGEAGIWDVQCPAKILELYPVSLKLTMSPTDPEEASLRVICDPNKPNFQWRLVQGIDFESENITFTVTSVDISYCPIISTTDLQNFFHQMKLDPEDIQTFVYQTWRTNISFPVDFLKIMPNLEVVDLTNNKLETLPSFQGLEFLNQLNLRGNHLTNIPKGTFTTNINLEQIRLGGNRISKLEEQIFPLSTVLLDLVDNDITTITNESFANLKNLQVLYLNNNPLARVHTGAFKFLKNLTELSLDYSRLFSLPVLKQLPKLANLSISYSLFMSTKLVTTDASESDYDATTETGSENTNFYSSTVAVKKNDYIDGVIRDEGDEIGIKARSDENNNEELIGDLYALKKLILINDDLKSLSWLGYLPNLTDLVLSQNQLEVIPEGLFRNLPSVTHAHLNKNAINELSEMDAPFLTYIDLSNNFLRGLKKNYFKNLRKMKVLIISNNKIEYVHPKAFEFLQDLVILDLSNNRISFDQGPPIMSRKLELQYDMMTTTMIPTTTMESEEDKMNDEVQQQSPLQYCTNLERVNLKNNLITRIFMDWTFVPANLKTLNLSQNKIQSLHPRDLYFISQDVRFDLRYNEISYIDMDFAELLLEPLENKNIVVLLDHNPLHCDCHAISFKKFSVKSYKLQYSNLRCYSPENLKDRKFVDVAAKDLRCMVSEACPRGCTCWELPSENLIKMNCKSYDFGSIHERSALKNFTDVQEPLEIELDLSGTQLKFLNKSFVEDITTQFRLVNLTNTGLTSMSFLDILKNNNSTKFALANNPFECDGCEFQKIWLQHYKIIVDIPSITCISSGVSNKEVHSFYDLAKDAVCTEAAISDEIQFLIILLGIAIPLIIVILICAGKHQQLKDSTVKKPAEATLNRRERAYTPTRSRVAYMDNSKF